MKSIVLCENTLVKHQDDTRNLKELAADELVEEKVKLNGTVGDKKLFSEGAECNSQVLLNGKNGTKGGSSVLKVTENGKDKTAEEVENSEGEKCAPSDEKKVTVKMEINISSKDESSSFLEDTKDSFDVSENLNKNSGAVYSSKHDCTSKENKHIICVNVDSIDEVCDEVSEVLIIDDNERVTEQVAINSSSKCIGKKFSSDGLAKVKNEKSEQSLSEEIFDIDSNKENVKNDKTNSVEDLSKEVEDESSCEIQVQEVQSVVSKDFIWLPSDSEKSLQGKKESTHKKEMEELEEIFRSNKESHKRPEEEKESDCQALMVIETINDEREESEELQMVVEEGEPEIEINEENKSEEVEWNEHVGEAEEETLVSKKRPITDEKGEDPSAKKIKLLENQNAEDKSTVESSVEVDIEVEEESSKVGRVVFDGEDREERVTGEEKQDSEKKGESTELSSSFLAGFRGNLKNMTRSDLEELIVQKLCEVITERSTVGELRRKAQALEQDQERWKVRVQALTKQIKEMEMVMKKYMSEVQKQLKEGSDILVTPLRVTRSVGLQVSFYTYQNRGSKPNVSSSANPCPAQSNFTRNCKGSPKPLPQYSPMSQSVRGKSTPVSPKSSPPLQKSPVAQQRRQSVATNSVPLNRNNPTPIVPNTNRPIQVQTPAPRPPYKPPTSAAQQQQQTQHQSHQLQQQHPLQQQPQHQQQGSKVIDLTEDDDQRLNNTGKLNAQARVAPLMQQSGASPTNRFAYLVPASSTSAGLGGAQNRPVLIATPTVQSPQQNRQVMCSMPPLLFKGGNQMQPTSQPQSNQNNRAILPKTPRHPAPLPQAPIRNWANMKQLPPRPALKISKVQSGIVLSWNMVLGPEHAPIRSYQLYAYQESNTPPATSLWKKVGDVKALPLPMACTLTQFMSGHKYHFAVRAVDLHSRIGPFSFPGTIVLVK